MSSRSIPQHRFQVGEFGRCTLLMPVGTCNTVATRPPQVCRMLPDDPCHRFYPCREGCGPTVDFLSCESRDKHEANVHGSGW